MEIKSKRVTARAVGLIGLSAAFLVWLQPLFMLPFVNVLPYLHTTLLTDRLLLSSMFYISVCALIRAAMTPQQWNAVRGRAFKDWKDASGVILGLIMAIYLTADLSANMFGLLVKALPGKPFSSELVVTSSKAAGSNHKAVELELLSPDHQSYEITLSRRVFGALPTIKQGDVIRIEGEHNFFGSYVSRFIVLQKQGDSV